MRTHAQWGRSWKGRGQAEAPSADDAAGWFAGHWLTAAEALLAGPVQVAIAGPDSTERDLLRAVAARRAHGGAVVLAGEPGADGVPLLADRPLVDGKAAAYVCRGYVCDRPVTSPDDLVAALSAGSEQAV